MTKETKTTKRIKKKTKITKMTRMGGAMSPGNEVDYKHRGTY